MGQSSSPYGTTTDQIPGIGDTEIWKFGGLGPITFASLTLMLTYTTKEKANIAASSPIWKNNQEISLTPEFPARRIWSPSLQHARTVRIEATQFVLDADDDNVLFAVDQPAGATGAIGDVSVDSLNRMIYKKTGATTWVPYLKVGTKVPWRTDVTASSTLTLADMNRVTPVNAAAATVHTLPLAADAWALQPGGFIELFIKGAGVPTFAVQSGQTAARDGGGAGGAQYRSIAARVISATEWAVQS